MIISEMKACPFCGGNVCLITNHWKSKVYEKRKMDYLTIICEKCDVIMQDLPYKCDTPVEIVNEFKEKLIDRWNERVKDKTDEKSSEERLEDIMQEIIDVAKQSEAPSKVIKEVGKNFLYVATALEIIEEGERQ